MTRTGRDQVNAIFPRDPSLEYLHRAAWDNYLLFNRAYRSAYELLSEHYRAAVMRLGDSSLDASTDQPEDETREALIGHILGLYVHGVVDIEPGSLVDLFFEHAPVETRARLTELVGLDLMNENNPTQQALVRLQRLWEWRLRALQKRAASDLDELKGFGWWFESGKFDDTWALAQLNNLLTANRTIEADAGIIKQLAALRHEHLAQVVACLASVIDAAQRHVPAKPWFVTANYDEIRVILEDGIKAEDQTTVGLARQTLNRLFARGHTQFEDLLT